MTKIIFEFPSDNNQQLIDGRQISFEEVIAALENGQLLDVIEHPNQAKLFPSTNVCSTSERLCIFSSFCTKK